ncbi:pentatricopeptide repeat-containing protein At4g17616 [Silene latifolia]|uniref:pentatricopeptide repeat-containing protein At4g17616 n=1 Tax=Silene latifolia TaxID=37657 RepID=UPI003D777A7B
MSNLLNMRTSVSSVVKNGESIVKHSISGHLKQFCTSTLQKSVHWGGSTDNVLQEKLRTALLDCKDDEVWGVFRKFKSEHGYPPPYALSKLICGFSYSLDNRLLPKACNIVFKIAKENPSSLQADSLSKLCLSLARARMPIPASKILRFMLMKKIPPKMDVLGSVFMHMVKTDAGTHLASNVLLEFCDHFHHLSLKKTEYAVSMKPTTTIFNLVLEACMKIGSSLKAYQIIEAMAHIGVVADLHSVLLFSYIYELNGQRDELTKFKGYIDRVSVPLSKHYFQFYDKLLRLHFKFDDVDAAARLVEDIYFHSASHPLKTTEDLVKPYLVPIGSPYLLEGLKSQVVFELLDKDPVFLVNGEENLLVLKNGNPILTNKGLAQLVAKYKKSEKIGELSKLLAAIEKKQCDTQDDCICRDVIHACICSGFLETAHDILDDMEIANVYVPSTTYMLLLNAYCKEKMSKEAEALAKQIKRAGLTFDASGESIVSNCLLGVADSNSASPIAPTSSRQSDLTTYLVQEMRKGDNGLSKIYELNSSIYFFCKAKMLDDARKIYKKMEEIKLKPTVHTFAYLIQAYSSLEDYREITILWGDIKRYMARGCSLAHRDLYELLLINFLRGGYFERVLEVLGLMKDHGMYADRWLYRQEFLRLHKNLYRRLKAEDATTEAQRMRIEHVKAFRMWVSNN